MALPKLHKEASKLRTVSHETDVQPSLKLLIHNLQVQVLIKLEVMSCLFQQASKGNKFVILDIMGKMLTIRRQKKTFTSSVFLLFHKDICQTPFSDPIFMIPNLQGLITGQILQWFHQMYNIIELLHGGFQITSRKPLCIQCYSHHFRQGLNKGTQVHTY